MKVFFSSLLLASIAFALPSPSSFVIQSEGQQSILTDLGESAQAASERIIDVTYDKVSNVGDIIDSVKEESQSKIVKFRESIEDLVEKARNSADDDDASPSSWIAAQEGDSSEKVEGLPLPPHHPPSYLDFSNYTINEILNKTLHHHHHHEHKDKKDSIWPGRGEAPHHDDPAFLPLHRLAWLVNRSSDIQEALDQKHLTLLAPDDRALTPPHHRRGPPPHHRDGQADFSGVEEMMEREEQPLVHPIYHVQRSLKMAEAAAEFKGDGDDDDEKKKRRERFERIITYVLKYHLLPNELTGDELVNKATLETSLNSSRVKVEPALALLPHPYPTIKFNGYAYKRLTVRAKNGLIHLIGAPLLPPLSPLNQLFLFPQGFATLTSDLQKVDLADALLPHWQHSSNEAVEEEEDGSHLLMDQLVDEIVKENNLTAFSIFAPTNFAFNRLGPKIVALLHSPFPLSKKILKYVLSYHVVPDVVFYSDFVKGAKPSDKMDRYIVSEEVDTDVPFEWIEETHHGRSGLETVHADAWPIKITLPNRPSHRGPPPPPPPPGHGHDDDDEHPHPPHHGPTPHHPPPHHKANVTRYELPTLLTEENKNATLKVLSIAYRRYAKGPVHRSIVVLPNRPPHHEHDHDKDEAHVECPHRRGPPPARPVRVLKTDIPARNGAIQVITSLLRPPMPHHDSKAFGKPSPDPSKRFHRRGLGQLFD